MARSLATRTNIAFLWFGKAASQEKYPITTMTVVLQRKDLPLFAKGTSI